MRSKKTIIIFFLFSVFVLILLSVSGAILKHHYSQDKKVEKYISSFPIDYSTFNFNKNLNKYFYELKKY